MRKMPLAGALLALALATAATNSQASLILSMDLAGGSGDVENVLLNMDETGTTVTGNLNQSGAQVNFTGTEDLVVPGNGQARIEAVNGGTFDFISIMLNDASLGFNRIQFNIDAADDGFADITLTDQFGIATVFSNQAIDGRGQNFFTGDGLNGTIISSATIQTNVDMAGISDLQQIRLGSTVIPITPTDPQEIPEPGSLALLGLGLGLLSFAGRRRLKG